MGFSNLQVRNPLAPMIQSFQLQPNGSATAGFFTEPDVFYLLEATTSLAAPNWQPPTTAYQLGTGGAGILSAPPANVTSRFYRLRVE